jgi:hypothetical protein
MDGALSLRPSDAQAGGFLDDLDVTLREARFVIWDYMGKANPAVALKVTMEEADGITHEQYYSAGDPNKVTPSPDGKTLIPQAGATGLNANTNALAFIGSIINAGFPEDKLGSDASVFDGLGAHVNQVAQPKRAGLKDQKEGKTYLLVTKITRLPWDAPAPKAAKGAPVNRSAAPAAGPRPVTPAPAAAPAVPSNGAATPEMIEKARGTVISILTEKGGSVPRSKLSQEAFRLLSNDPDRNAIVKLVYDDGFLTQSVAEGVFAFDGQTVTLG